LVVFVFFVGVFALVVVVAMWTSCRVAGRVLGRPGGRAGPGRVGLGAAAGRAVLVRRCRKSRRTRAG
jgi:hypothetical protein